MLESRDKFKIIWLGRANVVNLNSLFLVIRTLVIGSDIVK